MTESLSHPERTRIVDWLSASPFFKVRDIPHEFYMGDGGDLYIRNCEGRVVCKVSEKTRKEVVADESSAKAPRFKIAQRLASYRLSPSERGIVDLLKRHGSLPSSDIIAKAGLHRTTARRILYGLVRVGIVERLDEHPAPLYRMREREAG